MADKRNESDPDTNPRDEQALQSDEIRGVGDDDEEFEDTDDLDDEEDEESTTF